MPIDMDSRASDDLLIVAGKLYEYGTFSNGQDVIDFFEKPWKWKSEYKEACEADSEYKDGEDLRDPDLYCSDCHEVRGGSVQWQDNEFVVNAHCGCFLKTLEEYEDGKIQTNVRPSDT